MQRRELSLGALPRLAGGGAWGDADAEPLLASERNYPRVFAVHDALQRWCATRYANRVSPTRPRRLRIAFQEEPRGAFFGLLLHD